MGTYSPDPEIAELRQRWLARERRARAANAALRGRRGWRPSSSTTYEHDSPEELAARQAEIIERRSRSTVAGSASAAISPSEVWDAGVEFGPADRSALAGAAYWASQFGDPRPSGGSRQRPRSRSLSTHLTRGTSTRRRSRIAAAAPETVRNTFWADYQYFHASVPPNIEWPSDRELRAGALRHPATDSRPASRLRRWSRSQAGSSAPAGSTSARQMTCEMLADLHAYGEPARSTPMFG